MTQEQSQILDEVRVNLVFEHMIVSVLTGAFAGAALVFLFALFGVLSHGGFSLYFLLTAVLKTMLAGFLIFLVGFFASVVVLTPLHRVLEKSRRRHVWPYAAAIVGVAAAGLAGMKVLPLVGGLDLSSVVAVLTSSLVTAFEFGRRMRPVWRAADRAGLAENNIDKHLIH